MHYLFLPHNAYKVARRPLPFYSPAIPFKYCYFFCRLNQTHFIGMEFRKNLNKCPIQGAHNPDNVYNLTHFRSFILRFLNETSSKIHLQILGVVHRGGPWTGYMKGSINQDQRGSPWTRGACFVSVPDLYLFSLQIQFSCIFTFYWQIYDADI